MDTYLEWGDLCSKAGLILTVENEVHVRHTVAPTAEILAEMIRGLSVVITEQNLLSDL